MRNGASAILLAVALALSAGHAAAVSYTFTNIADSTGPFRVFSTPVLNNTGMVVFGGILDTGEQAIVTTRGGPATTIADSSGPFNSFGFYSLNGSGTVAFYNQLDAQPEEGIFTSSSGGTATTIVDSSGPFEVFGNVPSIDNSGTVAFLGFLGLPSFEQGIFTGSGGPTTTLYDSSGPFMTFVADPVINASGTVAFSATLDTFEAGLFTGSGGPVTTIADTSGPFDFGDPFGLPAFSGYSLNDSGTVAFRAFLDTGGMGIFIGSGGPTGTIVDSSGPFDFLSDPVLNNTGTVVFTGRLDDDPSGSTAGIFTGPDPVADKVIGIGDPLFGSTLTNFSIFSEALNDAGQIAFFYVLANRRTGIALADPLVISEPGTLALLGLGLAGLGFTRRRRANWPHVRSLGLCVKSIITACASLGVLAAAHTASAATLVAETTFGGHTYQLWDELGISWQNAQANAAGLGGYLAVFTDLAETTAVYDALIGNGFFQPREGQDVEAWLGATPADGSMSTIDPNNWAWVTGETWTAFDASNWAAFEPNGDSEGLAINRFGNSQWNDEGDFVGGYIVEINSVPEPGTLALLGLGLLGLGLTRRRRAA